ncbi:MAG: flagellar type III secretion system pore protein FliP [Alphaproteobacteria bacterium]|nr:flagellar type III secretion system pore protein FliP [Alphaproteobacteria bacterium]
MKTRPLLAAATVLSLLATVLFVAPALAQNFSFDFGEGPTATGRVFQLIVLLTVLSLAPSILIMTTSFIRIVVVFSFLRSALGLQQTPPNTVLVGLALFLTLFIMTPTFETAYSEGLAPLIENEITEEESFERTTAPFHAFMRKQVREKDLVLFLDIADMEDVESPEAVPLRVLIPAFVISELRRAFEIGFLIFVPFLVIDMVVASILMSMGMMMLPPIIISLPFKLIFFVLVDGWYLVAGSVVQSFTP